MELFADLKDTTLNLNGQIPGRNHITILRDDGSEWGPEDQLSEVSEQVDEEDESDKEKDEEEQEEEDKEEEDEEEEEGDDE
jgi:hypothetical protein